VKPKTKLSPLQKVAIVLFVLACLAVFAIFRFLDYPVASWQLNREYERARKNGIPLTQAELKPKDFDEKQNAAPELERIGKIINQYFWRVYHSDPSKADRLTLAYCKPFLTDFYDANAKKEYCSRSDLDLGSLFQAPEISGLKSMSRLLNTLAKEDANKGRWNDALFKAQNQLKLAKHLESQPTGHLQAVSAGIARDGYRTIEQLAERSASNPKRLFDLLDLAKGFDPEDNTKKGLLGDCYLMIATLRNTHFYGGAKAFADYSWSHGDPPDPDKEPRVALPIIRSGEPNKMVARALMAKSLSFWNDAVSSDEWKNNDYRGLAVRMYRFSELHSVENTHRVSDRLNVIMMPEFRNSFRPYLRVVTAKKTACLLLRLLLYKLQHGSFPKNLKLVSADITDPYLEGQNLHYRTDGKSVAIWSVGENLTDDGGHKEKSNDVGAYYPAYKPIY